MSRKLERGSKMSIAEGSLVDLAREWTDAICRDEQRSRADFTEAMRRVSLKLRIPFGFLSELTYRPPKRISAGRFLILARAYDEHLQRQKHREEKADNFARSWLGQTVLRAIHALEGGATEMERQAEEDISQAESLDRQADALDDREDGGVSE